MQQVKSQIIFDVSGISHIFIGSIQTIQTIQGAPPGLEDSTEMIMYTHQDPILTASTVVSGSIPAASSLRYASTTSTGDSRGISPLAAQVVEQGSTASVTSPAPPHMIAKYGLTYEDIYNQNPYAYA